MRVKPDFEYVDLVFENCEVVRVPPKYVKSLYLSDITRTIITNYVHQFIEMWNCKEFEIELAIEVLGLKTTWGRPCDAHFKRFKDLCSVVIKTKDKEHHIGIPWKSKDRHDVSNKLLKTKYEEDSFTIKSKE